MRPIIGSRHILYAGCVSPVLAPLAPRPSSPQGVLAPGGRVVRRGLPSGQAEVGGAPPQDLGRP